jgi:hypothetical protein
MEWPMPDHQATLFLLGYIAVVVTVTLWRVSNR